NPVDLGYLAVYVAQASLMGTLKDNTMQAKVARRTVGHARRSRIARGHHGQGSAHAEERDRVGESVPVHEGQYRPVQLLDLERRETILGMPKGGGEGMDASSSPQPAVRGSLNLDELLRARRPIERPTRVPIVKEDFNAEVPRKSRCRHGRQ